MVNLVNTCVYFQFIIAMAVWKKLVSGHPIPDAAIEHYTQTCLKEKEV